MPLEMQVLKKHLQAPIVKFGTVAFCLGKSLNHADSCLVPQQYPIN